MEISLPQKNKLGVFGRKAVFLSSEELISTAYLLPGQTLPLVIQPSDHELRLVDWAIGNVEFIRDSLQKHGGLLFRNFNINGAEECEQFIKSVSAEPLEYRERSSPRHNIKGNIYTSTDYPSDHYIFPHNENSYQHTWPLKIFFFCDDPPQNGGETLIADCRKIYQLISPEVRESFIDNKIMYVRNFRKGWGLSWQTVFQTADKSRVEEYCTFARIRVEWIDDDCLRTRQTRPAVLRHPHTDAPVWFNHGAFFHVTTLELAIREELIATFKEEDLPNNTYYGDGSPIESEVMDEIPEAYWHETIPVAWRKGDLLLLDNMLTAHGRAPYSGSRSIMVGMAEPFTGQTAGNEGTEKRL